MPDPVPDTDPPAAAVIARSVVLDPVAREAWLPEGWSWVAISGMGVVVLDPGVREVGLPPGWSGPYQQAGGADVSTMGGADDVDPGPTSPMRPRPGG